MTFLWLLWCLLTQQHPSGNWMNCSSPFLTNFHLLKSIITVINCHQPFLPPPNHLLPPHPQASHQHRIQMPQPHPQLSRAPTSCPSRVLYMGYFADLICQVVCSRQLYATWRPSVPRFLSLSRRKEWMCPQWTRSQQVNYVLTALEVAWDHILWMPPSTSFGTRDLYSGVSSDSPTMLPL